MIKIDEVLFIPVLELVKEVFACSIEWNMDIGKLQNIIEKISKYYKNTEYSIGGAIAYSIMNNKVFSIYDQQSELEFDSHTLIVKVKINPGRF